MAQVDAPSPPTSRSMWWKKAATATLALGVTAALSVGLYGSQSQHFQHHTHRLLAEMASSTSIQVQFAAKNAVADSVGGLNVTALLFPRTGGNQSLTFDGRLSYEFLGQEFNFTVVGGRGYVTVENIATRELVRNDCLKRVNVPPVHEFADAVRNARVVDDASTIGLSSSECADGKIVEFTFADEPYVFCSRANGAIDKVHGEDIEAIVQLLRDNTVDAPSILSLVRPNGKLIEKCELLSDDGGVTPSATSSRMLSRLTTHTKDVVDVLTGNRRMASSDDCSTACAGGKKICLFVHGLGKSLDSTVADSYSDAWGDAQTKVNCCSQTKFMRMDTVNNAWYGDVLSKKVCDAAVSLSGSTDPMNLQNIALIGHSMGNLIIANAAMKNLCAVGSTSKWIALAGPMSGSLSANLATNVCVDDPTILDDALVAVLKAVNVCPAGNSVKSMVYEGSSISSSDLNALYVQADAAFGKYITSLMCGVDSTGLITTDSVTYAALDLISGHASTYNDGAVEITSCRGPIGLSSFVTSWGASKYYRAAINHGDATLRNGDGVWGSDRKPVKWFNCQFS